jgi:SAM-dependent methyltransferase
MTQAFQTYYDPSRHKKVLDVGSRQVSGHQLNHRQIISGSELAYTGVDVVEGPNVDVVMKKPYRLPLSSKSCDIIFCGQVFEHIPYFWITFLEFARVLRRDGIILLKVPSRGHRHSPPTDCWRFYPDGMRALAEFSRLELLRVHTDFPPKDESGRRLDYARIDPRRYWGDTVAVFKKTEKYPPFIMAAIREPLVMWGNRLPKINPEKKPQTN